jgi:hypothetical protein
MAFPVKQVRTLEVGLRIIEEAGKNPSEKRTDVAKWKGATKQMKINEFLCTFFDLVNKYRQI